MNEEEKKELLDTVKKVVELDVLSVNEAMMILGVCRGAIDRATASATEMYLISAIGGEAQ